MADARVVVIEDALYIQAPTQPARRFVSTDGSGRYHIDDVREAIGAYESVMVGALRPGHFADFKWVFVPRDTEIDFQLDPWVYIAPGEAVHGRIDDSRCAGLGYGGRGGTLCQRFALAAASRGMLDVVLSAAVFDFDVDVVMPDGTFGKYFAGARSPLRFTMPVEPGLTYEIRVAAIGTAREFELATAFR